MDARLKMSGMTVLGTDFDTCSSWALKALNLAADPSPRALA
ncbi:MAG: hypothetical protein OEY91_05425 [Nitrospirota bacterium]|nr:hypothetical protein [Nitrospirota bacterium]